MLVLLYKRPYTYEYSECKACYSVLLARMHTANQSPIINASPATNHCCSCSREPKTSTYSCPQADTLLAYIPACIDMMFIQPMITSTSSISTLIRLKCFPSQAAYCVQSASNSRCSYTHTRFYLLPTHIQTNIFPFVVIHTSLHFTLT